MVNGELNTQLDAGREMDILVAEQVMDWQLETDEAKLRRLNEYFAKDEKRRWWRNPEGGWHCDPPPYSSDIAAAWNVVKRMNSRGQDLFLHQSIEKNEVAFDDARAFDHHYISEKSLTEAICKAALMACNIPSQEYRLREAAFAPPML